MTTLLWLAFALVAPPIAGRAPDSAALYKANCAVCHGADGSGNIGPSIRNTTLTEQQLTDLLTRGGENRGGPHTAPMAGLTADQAAAIASYVRTLKK